MPPWRTQLDSRLALLRVTAAVLELGQRAAAGDAAAATEVEELDRLVERFGAMSTVRSGPPG